MKQSTLSIRYIATPFLRQQIVDQGRRADWLAQQAGLSKSFLSKVMAGQKTISEVDARVLTALLHADFGVLFEVPMSADIALSSNGVAA